MDTFLLILTFILGLIMLFGLGGLIGHIFKLDEYLKKDPLEHSAKHSN